MDANDSAFTTGLNSFTVLATAGDSMTATIQFLQEKDGTIRPLDGADVDELDNDVFMRFQAIKLAGDGCSSNYRFLIYNDGRFFMQENSAKDCAARPANTRFNKPFDDTPTIILDSRKLGAIRKAVAVYGFDQLPNSIIPDGKVFDGAMEIMEVRTGTGIKRVISVQNGSKAIEAILEVIWAQVY